MKKLLFLVLCLATLGAAAQRPATDEALALQYYQTGDYEKASVLFGKLFEQTGNESYFDIYLTTLLKGKNYTVAEQLVKTMIKTRPANPAYQISLGRVYLETGRKAAADKIFETAIETLPKDEFKIREIANAFYRTESYDLAIRTFLQGRKLLNNESLFTFDLLGIYRFKKDKEMLVQEYITALATMPELLFQAQSAFAVVFDSNADYDVLAAILLKKLQKEPDKEVYTELLIWQYLQQKQYEMALRQLIAQDKRIKNNGEKLFAAAKTFLYNQEYPVAIKAFEYILTKGKESDYYLPARLALLDTRYTVATTGDPKMEEITAIANEYDAILQEFGKKSTTIFAVKAWARLQAYYLNNPATAVEALEAGIKIPGVSSQEIGKMKIDLGDIYVAINDTWEAVLVYQQVAKQFENAEIGNEANYKAAMLSFYQGNFEYAKSQADVLKASTTQLIANDALNLSLLISDNLQNSTDSLALKMYADAELLQFRNLSSRALAKLDSIGIVYKANSLEDDILMSKAKIYTKANQFDLAAAALNKLIENYNTSLWIDDALFTLADLYENKLSNSEKAKNLYQKLITDYPGSMYTAEARKRFRNLRGDVM